jgi:hypothetical protein
VDILPCLSVAGNVQDPRISENAGVKLRRFFGLLIEPQTRGNLLNVLHDLLLQWVGTTLNHEVICLPHVTRIINLEPT